MGKYKEKLIILSLLFIGVFFYFYKLSEIPKSLYIDEIIQSYSAYSIITTGRDEYGKLMPSVFRSFGQYNPSFYTYLTTIPIYFFGLNEFSARFVSAIAGLLSAFVFYFFLRNSYEFKSNYSKYVMTFLFIICPWMILYSRVGLEVSLGYYLFSLGILFFLKALKESKYYIFGFLMLSLSTYSAYTERFIAPLFVVLFFLVFHKQVDKKYFIKGMLISLISQIPNFHLLTTPAFFPKEGLWSNYNGSFAREFLSKFLTYFSPASLFFLPDPDKQRSIPELSVFYSWMVAPYLVGLYSLWFNKKSDFIKFIFILAIISPIPAALTRDPFSTHRALPLILPLMLIISLGFDKIVVNFNKISNVLTLIFLVLISLMSLWRGYVVLLPNERARHWGYGYKELANEISSRKDKHYIIDESRLKPSYIYLTYYLKYPPIQFQKIVDPSIKEKYYQSHTFISSYIFENVEIKNIKWETDICKENVLVGDEYAVSEGQAKEHNLSLLFQINDPVGNIIFKGYEINKNESKNCN